MKIILTLGLLSILTACGGSSKDKDNVGFNIDENSDPLAQVIADGIWCSRADFYDDGADPFRRNPMQEVVIFYSNGDFEFEIVEKNTDEIVEATDGQWGVSEETLTVVIDNERVKSELQYNEETDEIAITSEDSFADVYYLCGAAEAIDL
jgi:hypothetical protein